MLIIATAEFNELEDSFKTTFPPALNGIISKYDFDTLIRSLNRAAYNNKGFKVLVLALLAILNVIAFCIPLGWAYIAYKVLTLDAIIVVLSTVGIGFCFLILNFPIFVFHNILQCIVIRKMRKLLKQFNRETLQETDVVVELEKVPSECCFCDILWIPFGCNITRVSSTLGLKIVRLQFINVKVMHPSKFESIEYAKLGACTKKNGYMTL